MNNMCDEIIDAILETYKDDEEIAVDCLLYLAAMKTLPMGYVVYRKLEKMGRCTQCGTKLQEYTYIEQHDELDEPPIREVITDLYCPQCDIGAGGIYGRR